MQKFILFALIMSIFLVACTSENTTSDETPEPQPASISENPIIIGDVGNDPDSVIRTWQSFADYIAENLTEQGIDSGVVRAASSVEEMAALLESGEVDIYIDSSYPSILVSELSGSELILRRWRDNIPTYNSVFFALTSSGIASTEDLVGGTVAFDSPFSTSGFFLPSLYLQREDYVTSEVDNVDAVVAEDEIGFIFSRDDANSIQWVISELVDAGVTDSVTYNNLPEETRDLFTIIAETESLPRQMVSLSPTMDADMRDAITSILTTMDESEDGQAALETIETSQFDEFPEGVGTFRMQVTDMLDEFRQGEQ